MDSKTYFRMQRRIHTTQLHALRVLEAKTTDQEEKELIVNEIEYQKNQALWYFKLQYGKE